MATKNRTPEEDVWPEGGIETFASEWRRSEDSEGEEDRGEKGDGYSTFTWTRLGDWKETIFRIKTPTKNRKRPDPEKIDETDIDLRISG